MRYFRNDNIFREIKDQLDIKTVMENEGIEFNSKGWCKCPFHNEKTPSMHTHNGKYSCFGCGEHGDIFDFIKHEKGYSSMMDSARYLVSAYSLNVSFGDTVIDKEEQKKAAAKQKERNQKKEERKLLCDDLKEMYKITCDLRQMLSKNKQNISGSIEDIDKLSNDEITSLRHFTNIDSFNFMLLNTINDLGKIKNETIINLIQEGAKLCRKILTEMN